MRKNVGRFIRIFIVFCLLFAVFCGGCRRKEAKDLPADGQLSDAGLVWVKQRELSYAREFSIDDYQEGYVLLSVADGSRFLLVPEGKEVPEGLDKSIVVLKKPMERVYLAATAAMDMFDALDAVDVLTFSGTKADGWYIDGAKEAMEEGRLLYAGKYNAPDYERLITEKCSLAIENTMIHHSPEVRERLIELGIPVLVDYSSYEEHPLGRTEWVKFYGALTGKDELAEQVFQAQKEDFAAASVEGSTGKTAAFFYITSNGAVNVRKPADYLPKMIELAGGSYSFSAMGEEDDTSSSMNIQIEDFYAAARDADVLIYNSAVDGELEHVEDLLEKCGILKDAKAVLSGNVWCAREDIYQKSMSIGTMIKDLHLIFTDPDGTDEKVNYFFRMKP